jgi:hypothetical protein
MFARLMGLKDISPDGLHQMIQKQQVTVIDVNSRQSWIKARVPGALNLDYNEIIAGAQQFCVFIWGMRVKRG